jgi:Tfp pilus assembly protein PilO
MNSLSSKTSLILLTLLTMLLASFFVLEFYRVKSENQETSRLLSEVNQAADQRAAAQSIRFLQKTATEDVNDFEALTISPSRLVEVIESIEAAGRALSLETIIASVDKPEANSSTTLQSIDIVVETSGSWAGTSRFLKAIESLPTRVTIQEARLSKQDSAWDSQVKLSFYSFE